MEYALSPPKGDELWLSRYIPNTGNTRNHHRFDEYGYQNQVKLNNGLWEYRRCLREQNRRWLNWLSNLNGRRCLMPTVTDFAQDAPAMMQSKPSFSTSGINPSLYWMPILKDVSTRSARKPYCTS